MSIMIAKLVTITTVVLYGLLVVAYAQRDPSESERKLLKAPIVSVPELARTANVGGKVIVGVELFADGSVAKVLSVSGPDWVCPNYSDGPIDALRETARSAALRARFDVRPADDKKAPKTSFLTFNFPFDADSEGENSGGLANSGAKVVGNGDVRESSGEAPRIVSGGVLTGKAISLPSPGYPMAAKAVGASGTVTVQVLITGDGRVYSAKPISGHPLLQSASRSSACQGRFTPTTLLGNPVKVSGVITYNFAL